MVDYEAVDLGPYATAFDERNSAVVPVWTGAVLLHGLPFAFAAQHNRSRIVRAAPGEAISMNLAAGPGCRTITFAHRVGDDGQASLPSVGQSQGSYLFTFEDGDTVNVELREGFEITVPFIGDDPHSTWGARPSLAVPDRSDGRPVRYAGAFADFGRRQTEVVEAGGWRERVDGDSPRDGQPVIPGWRFLLWTWFNPHPGLRVNRVEMRGTRAILELGAVCVGYLDEHPLRPEPARTVVASIPGGLVGDIGTVTIDVDRGVAGYSTPLMTVSPELDPLAAWGDRPSVEPAGVYARVSAIPSATVRVTGGPVVLSSGWAALRADDPGENSDIPALRITDRGRNWVRTTIVDDQTGTIVPCRVSFSSPQGVPYQPHGHPQHVNSNLASWHADVGADIRLGRRTYAYVDGSCEGWLPRGPVRAQVAIGFEYEPIDQFVDVGDDTRDLTLRIRRRYTPNLTRWYSGDTHVHFVSSFGGLREAQAEGVSVVNLLLAQWGSLFTSMEEFTGRPIYTDDSKTVLFASQENRQHFLGHLSLLGLKERIMPWSTDGPQEAELGSGLEATLADWADRCHAQGGLVVSPHFPAPNGEVASLIATERIDAAEICDYNEQSMGEYYRYLNAGFRIAVAGGTDKMSNDVPIGLSRTYVRIGADDDFSYESWCDALKAGRSYMSSGPIVEFTVDDADIGDTMRIPHGGAVVSVRAIARCIFPMFSMELVYRGHVVAATESSSGSRELRIETDVPVEGAGWMCLRVGGGGPVELTHHRDEWARAITAHTSPIYMVSGEGNGMGDRDALQHTLTLVERGRSYVSNMASIDVGPDVLHHHGGTHLEYLLAPFNEAAARLGRRLKSATDS